jgi:hypothetical protein
MTSVATLRWRVALWSDERLLGEYLTRRIQGGNLGERMITRIMRDELVDRCGAS